MLPLVFGHSAELLQQNPEDNARMHKSYDYSTALINQSSELQKESKKEVKPKAVRSQQDSVFARIAELNKEWQAGLLRGEQNP